MEKNKTKQTTVKLNINDNYGVENVTHMWYDHYEKLNSGPSKCDLNFDNVLFDDKMIVNTAEIMEAISNLPCNKSSGLDTHQC